MTSSSDLRPPAVAAGERATGAGWLMLVVLLGGQFMALLDGM